MPVTTRQLLRLIHAIEERFDLTNREKEELLSILDNPSEADESLESGYTRQGLSLSLRRSESTTVRLQRRRLLPGSLLTN